MKYSSCDSESHLWRDQYDSKIFGAAPFRVRYKVR
jgi:hypothetical protein